MRNCEGEGTTGVCRSSHGSSNRKDDSDQSTIGYLNLLLAALQRNCELERSVLAIRLVITGSWVRLESRMLSLKVNISKVHMSLTERAKPMLISPIKPLSTMLLRITPPAPFLWVALHLPSLPLGPHFFSLSLWHARRR
jgi:hypothetical protein